MKSMYDKTLEELLQDDLNSRVDKRAVDLIIFRIEKLQNKIKKSHLRDPKDAAEFYNYYSAMEDWLDKTDRSKRDELYVTVSLFVKTTKAVLSVKRFQNMFKKKKLDCFSWKRLAKSDYDEDLINDFLEEYLASSKVSFGDTYSYEEWEEMFHEFK